MRARPDRVSRWSWYVVGRVEGRILRSWDMIGVFGNCRITRGARACRTHAPHAVKYKWKSEYPLKERKKPKNL
jgi:hypothetical protein